MQAVRELSFTVGITQACTSLGTPRASFYRWQPPPPARKEKPTRPPSPRALAESERRQVLVTLPAERLENQSPAEVYAALLDERTYLGSERTRYRILAAEGEVRERRHPAKHPPYAVPRVVATRPHQVWSWDITKLLGPVKWTYFYLYVLLDLFSRYAVGWMVAARESAELAKHLVEETCRKQGIGREQLTLHADRGPSMQSKPLALLLADLGITKSHSRPRVSNDNPYSESQFKTLKYRPEFPKRFGSIQDARAFCQEFFTWYNTEHPHSGMGGLTPARVHSGEAKWVLEERQKVLNAAYERHPERFVRQPPHVAALPETVWINRPENVIETEPLLTNFSTELSQTY